MNKITRRIATVTTSIAVVGGALAAAAGSASAAALPADGHPRVAVAASADADRVRPDNGQGLHSEGHRSYYLTNAQWVGDQVSYVLDQRTSTTVGLTTVSRSTAAQ